MWFAERNWYDWFAMINVIPQRATNPKDINPCPQLDLVKKNYDVITQLMDSIKNPHILLAFWNTIDENKYFIDWLEVLICILKNYNPKFLKIGITKKWNPLHPSRVWYCKLSEIDINKYIKSKE